MGGVIMNLEILKDNLIDWYQKNKRELPWRQTKNPYYIWVSEIMLQQTRVEAVKDYYKRFLEELPTLEDLAYIEEDTLMNLWQGLGYYNRARNLKKAALFIVEELEGDFPDSYSQLIQLPGVGEYTAAAIASICFNEKVPAIDGNVMRVTSRLLNCSDNIDAVKTRKIFFAKLQRVMPKDASSFNQGMMELGATICIPNGEPLCYKCPLQEGCLALKNNNQAKVPVKKKKKKRRIIEKTVLVFKYKEQILIQKRPDKGLLAGLYEFPNLEGIYTRAKLIDFCQKQSIFYDTIKLLGNTTFVFTHVEWHMKGYVLDLNFPYLKSRQWIPLNDLEKYPFPTALKFYFDLVKKE